MAMQFSHAVGYRGLASLDGVTLLCTGGNINLTQDPIMSGGVWGAGYANAAPIAYAFNYLSLEGSCNFEWVTSGTVWQKLKAFALTDRTKDTNMKMLPDGKNGFEGKGWCSSISFEASEGAAVTGSFNFKGDPSGNNIKADGNGDTSAKGLGTPVASGLVGATLIAYWQTSVTTNDGLMKDVINWSCSYNSDLQVLKCCNYQDNAPISPDYILCGEMSAEGSYTIFTIKGDFTPSKYHSVRWIQFRVKDKTVKIPYVLINSGSTSMTTGASYVSCDFSFNGIGDGVNSIITMS